MLGCRRIRVTKARVRESAEVKTVGVGEAESVVVETDAEVEEAKVIVAAVTGGRVGRRREADRRGRRRAHSLADLGACH